MKHKLFISHSSKQKKFVEELHNLVGCDYMVVDKYTFESGEELWQEIRHAIDECDFFVYLISREALVSDWVGKEMSYVRDKVDEGIITFCPFIIDKNVEVNNANIPRWIKNYLLELYEHPKQLARLLKGKILRNIWEHFPSLKKMDHLFVGRSDEMGRLEQDFYGELGLPKISIIVSGLPHIGRKRILREFVASKINVGGDPNDIIEIKLNENDSVQDFAIQLNDIVCDYTYEDLLDVMKNKRESLITSVNLLNSLEIKKEFIVIDDEKCIVQPNGRLTEWFVDIIKSQSLKSHLHLCVASRYTPRPDISSIFPQIVALQLQPLRLNEMRSLLNAYASLNDIEITSHDTSFFLTQFSGFPEQVFFTIETIKKSNIAIAKRNVVQIVSKFDNDYQAIVAEIKRDDREFQTLILLSRFEFISYEYLCEICGEDVADILEQFHYYSLTDSFGPEKQYISLNPAMVDYIKRLKFPLSMDYKRKLKEGTSKILKMDNTPYMDISQHLYCIKQMLKNGDSRINERYLIPSFALKVIIEEYNAKRDDSVITLADRILKGYRTRAYEDVIRNITYWLCCALCRKKDDRLFNEVEYFNGEPYSYNFLKGFYYRHKRNYLKAKDFYAEALNSTLGYGDEAYASKAEHEMVMVCMTLGSYDEAFDLAQNSYEKNPYNTYHIEAYFRCLVRSSHYDRDSLHELMSKMKESLDTNGKTIYCAMEAEYSYYIDHDFSKAIEILNKGIERNHKNPYLRRSLWNICKSSGAEKIYNNLRKKYEMSDNDEDIDFEND